MRVKQAELDARQANVEILGRIIDRGESLTPVLESVSARVAAAEQAILRQLAFGSLRWYLRLDAVLDNLLEKPLRAKDRDVHQLLISSLYQLEYLDTPDYAVVNTAASLSKALRRNWAKGLINAVLRQFLRERASLLAKVDEDAAIASATPTWLYAQIKQDWPQQAEDILTAMNIQAPMTLRVNSRHTDTQTYQAALHKQSMGADFHPYAPEALVLEQACPVTELPEFSGGLVSVQDAGAQLAAHLLQPQPGERVLDACAAPGGKACHLLELQPKLAKLLAVELDGRRLFRIQENLQRLQLQAELVQADAGAVEQWWDGQAFDKILLDVPCSATGVIRRHPDIKHLRRETDLTNLAAIQKQLLLKVWRLLAPGGMLLYATCSICRQENDAVITEFLNSTADAQEQIIAAEWGVALTHGRQILPGEAGMDGFYYALLHKSG